MSIKQNQEVKQLIYGIARPFIAILVLTFLGTLCYSYIEGWDLLDSFFMSIMSITTVGYGSPHPLSREGKLFTCIYLIFSVVIFLYIASEFARHVISINIREFFYKRQMDSRIKNLKGHFIICGFGRTGKAIASTLSAQKIPFVVIESDQESIKVADELGYLSIEGDATESEILQAANIETCKGLFAALSEDSDTLFLTITAKGLKPDIQIAVRCSKSGNEDKFKNVGVNEVISPFTISSMRMVSSLLRPLVADFLDEVMDTNLGLELRMEQFLIPENSALNGKSILDSEIRPYSGAYILAIKKGNKFVHNPTAEDVLHSGDYLIVLGTTDQLIKLKELIKHKGTKVIK